MIVNSLPKRNNNIYRFTFPIYPCTLYFCPFLKAARGCQVNLNGTCAIILTQLFQIMRGSPISNLRGRQDYTTSPYESNPRSSNVGHDSPPRGGGYSSAGEVDYWRGKCRQLEKELIEVTQELNYQLRKAEKIDDLEEKIELLLAQNTHFVEENQNLIKLVQQKNSDIQVWKRKFDTEYNNSNIAEAEKRKVFDHLNIKDQEHQIQIQKLLSEITRLQNEAAEADNLKKLEMHRLKNQYQSESIAQIQNLRRSQHGNTEIQELNIRKLKDTIQEKNYQIENLNHQIRLKNQELKTEANYSKNELKKLEEQKAHELDLVKTEYQNVKNNLIRQHKKNQDELKNLHEAKVKRLTYEIEEKKHEIEEGNNRLKRSGKEGEAEIARLVNENGNLRNELKENDNRNRTRIQELTRFYDSQFAKERETNLQREANLRNYYENEIAILQHVIAAKEEEIQRILEINKDLKRNEEHRLQLIKENNYELKHKIEDIIKHYEREIELSKIKISQLYEADLESLRSKLQNSYANHTLEVENLRDLLKETRENLAHEVQERLDLRRDYELRLTNFNVSHDSIQKELKTVISQRDKEIQGHTSKASLTHISHNQLLQTRNLDYKQIMNEKRTLEGQIQSKNKEIETLNLKVQQMLGLHKRDIEKLEEELDKQKEEHSNWLARQERETSDWHDERNELNRKIDDLNKKLQQLKKASQDKENELTASNNEKGLEIARLSGLIQELENKIKVLGSKNQVQVQNVEKTILETRTLMNSEKDKFFDTVNREKTLLTKQTDRVRQQLQAQINDLRKQNDILQDNYKKALIREQELQQDVRKLTDTVNKRSELQEKVINIGLSNNYFKNVAEIFKREVSA